MNCPKCKKPMKWQEGLLRDGSRDGAVGRYYCGHGCNLWAKPTDSRAIRQGKRLAEDLVGVPAMSKRITKHKCNVQIGILRAKQHCGTCGKPNYPIEDEADECHCKKCNCPYCQEHKKAK